MEIKKHNIIIGWPEEIPEAEYDSAGWFCTDTRKNIDSALQKNPKTIVEIGSWLGLSSRYLANQSKAHIYCLDTWKGSQEHKHQKHSHKLPLLWQTFCKNNWTYKDRITPVKGFSKDGLAWLFEEGIDVDLFYVDGSHQYEDVIQDLYYINEHWPKADIVGDDYLWSGVHSAVHEFARATKRSMWVEGRKSWAFFAEDEL